MIGILLFGALLFCVPLAAVFDEAYQAARVYFDFSPAGRPWP